MKNKIILILCMVFLISFVSAVPQTFNIHGKLSNSSGALTGTYEMNFSLYDVYSGGSYLWNDVYNVTTDGDGVYNIILKDIDLPFSAQYYLGVAVEDDAEMTPRVNLTSSGYTFRANVSDYLVVTNNYEIANLTLSKKITFAFGEMIDNIVDGWVRITGGLNVMNSSGDSKFFVNVSSGDVGIGTTSPDASLKVVGDVNITANISTPELCLNGDCQTAWPSVSGEGGWNDTGDIVELVDSANSIDANTLYIDNNNGRIGINTSTPQNSLHVIGDANISGLIYGNGSQLAGITSDDLDGYNSTYFMPLNKSVYGDFDFNGGWENGGFSIKDGDVYAQTGWFYNISSLEINHLEINGSIFPDVDNQFDIGNSSLRWRDLSLSGDLDVGTNISTPELCLNGDCQTAWPSVSGEGGWNDTGDIVELVDSANSIDANTLYINNSAGNVGIGTSSPDAKLQVEDGEFWLFNNNANPRIIIGDNGSSGQYGYLQWDSVNDYYRIETDGSNGLKIKGTNLAIGDIYPEEPLLVANGSTELFRVNNDGNVGIGTDAPDSILHLKNAVPFIILENTGAGDASYGYFIVKDSGGDTMGFAGFDSGLNSDFTIKTTNVSDGIDFQTNGSNSRMYINQAGNVGIGTTAPNGTLDVRGTICMNGGADCRSTWPTGSGTGAFIDTGSLAYYNGGNVGIGTDSPSAALTIKRGDEIGLRIENDDAGELAGMRFRASHTSGIYLHSDIVVNSTGSNTGSMQFRVPHTDTRMTILSSGNVGIGTSSPGYRLQVYGGDFQVEGVADTARMRLKTSGGTVDREWMLFGSSTDGAFGIYDVTASTRRMTIATNGNVGIGTPTPNGTLDVRGTICMNGGADCRSTWPTGSGTGAFIDTGSLAYYNGGNVGIGTDSPGADLSISVNTAGSTFTDWTTQEQAIFEYYNVNTDPYLGFTYPRVLDIGVGGGGGGTRGSYIRFLTANASSTKINPRMVIDPNGNVGIGTSSPSAKLDVQGDVNIWLG